MGEWFDNDASEKKFNLDENKNILLATLGETSSQIKNCIVVIKKKLTKLCISDSFYIEANRYPLMVR